MNNKRKIWVNKAASFEEAEDFDVSYYRAMSHDKRLDTLQLLREMQKKLTKNSSREKKNKVAKVVNFVRF